MKRSATLGPLGRVVRSLCTIACVAEHLLAPRRCLRCGVSLQTAVLSPPTLAAGVPVLCGSCDNALPRLTGELCVSCGLPLVSEARVCLTCREEDRRLTSLRGLYAYRGAAVCLVHALKERGDLRCASFLTEEILAAGLVTPRAPGTREEPRLLVPIPGSPRGRRRRGFDQAAILARRLSGATGIPASRALRRRAGSAQKVLNREERLANVASQLRVSRSALSGGVGKGVAGRAVVLVDDVATTGATLESAAALLLGAGALQVEAVVVARD